jgi:hypothetical protein
VKTVVVENRSPVTIGSVLPGGRIALTVDEAGVPFDAFWRRRLRDAALDKSLAIVPGGEAAPPPQALPDPEVAQGTANNTATAPKPTKKDKTP